jgi:hypothetical protein
MTARSISRCRSSAAAPPWSCAAGEAAKGQASREDRAAATTAELAKDFDVKDRRSWRHRAHHDREALTDALAMSYRGARASERERLLGVFSLDLTLSAEILTLVPRGGVR